MKKRNAAATPKQQPKRQDPSITPKQVDKLQSRSLFYPILLLLVSFFFFTVFSFGVVGTTTTTAITTRAPIVRKTPPPIAKDELFQQLQHATDFFSNCHQFPSPSLNYSQRCCEFSGPNKFHCFPLLVILGAQKSGTTALVSHLLMYPQYFDFPGLKELHFFDMDQHFSLLKQEMTQVLSMKPREKIPQRLTVESTPSYLADVKSCPRMDILLSKDTRFVLLLRNPVDRAWSEVNMKRRRVYYQEEFLNEIIPEFHAELRVCIAKCNFQCHFVDFMNCLPPRAGMHGRLIYLFKWIHTRTELVQKFLANCLQSAQAARHCTHTEFARVFVNEELPRFPQVLFHEARTLNASMRTCCVQPTYRCGSSCFPRPAMMSDVSRHYLFRGLYIVHLLHCLSSLDQKQVLILNHEDLRENPQQTLEQVFRHLAMPPSLQFRTNVTTQELTQALRDRFPDFETVNGWKRLDHDSDLEMDDETRSMLNDFYRPFNRRLFEFLNREPFPGWAV